MSKDYIVEVESLVKCFGDVRALCGLSFKVPTGVTGLIGPNGAGKTTVIRILFGLIKPDAGKARILGLDCWRESLKIRHRVSFLHERVALYPHMTGVEHLKLVAELRDLDDPSVEAEKALKLVEFHSGAENRQIRGYSAGMRQRLALAQALLGNPELVILDEPTSNLDPFGRIQLLETVNRLSKSSHVSFLISSHILPELEKVCNYVVLINKGKELKEGFLNELLKELPASTFRIKVEPKGPLAEVLKGEEYVERVWLEEDYVYVVTNAPEKFKRHLPLLITKTGVSLEEVKVEGKDLESLFKTSVADR